MCPAVWLKGFIGKWTSGVLVCLEVIDVQLACVTSQLYMIWLSLCHVSVYKAGEKKLRKLDKAKLFPPLNVSALCSREFVCWIFISFSVHNVTHIQQAAAQETQMEPEN